MSEASDERSELRRGWGGWSGGGELLLRRVTKLQ